MSNYQLYSAESNGDVFHVGVEHPAFAFYAFEDQFGFSPDSVTLERYLTDKDLKEMTTNDN